MIVGELVKRKGRDYIVVNKQGSLEVLPEIKWQAKLYLEIRQGLNIIMPLPELRKYIYKNTDNKKLRNNL